LAGAMEKFYYLKPGLIAILLFIGIKMMVSKHLEIPTSISLVVVLGILGITLVLSFMKAKQLNGQNGKQSD
jgi:tellurite resistance protein TerC